MAHLVVLEIILILVEKKDAIINQQCLGFFWVEGLQVIRLLIIDFYLNGNTDILFNLKLSLL